MNEFLRRSIDYANQKSYLDDLFRVYPAIPEGIREIDNSKWQLVEEYFQSKKNEELIKLLLKEFKIFPIKDPYVAYLRRDLSAINRNPKTVARLCGRLYELGLSEIYKRISEPKEINRQIGPMFRNWIKKGSLGLTPVPYEMFISNENNAILDGTDTELLLFAKKILGIPKEWDKGFDIIARFNKKYVIGEAKFLTDFGGHQDRQLEDALRIFEIKKMNLKREVIPVAILDGVLYIECNKKMHKKIIGEYSEENIMSVLVLTEYLYTL